MEVRWCCKLNLMLVNYEYPPIGGGAANASKEIANALTDLGHSVTVVTSKTPTSVGQLEENNVRVFRIPGIRRKIHQSNIFEMFVFLLSAFVHIGKIVRQNKIEGVIVFFTLPVGPLGLYLRKLKGLPYVVSLRGGDVPGLVPELVKLHRLLRWLRMWILSNADAVIANSASLAVRSESIDSVPVITARNGVDTDFYYPLNSNRGPIDTRRLKLLFVGRFERQKDVPGLLKCLARIRGKKEIEFQICLVGDGPERELAQDTAEHMGLADIVEWKGWVEKSVLRSLYQSSDCLLNLSSYEGLPNTVLEAMACGLPVVVSDITPHRELVDSGVDGFLVNDRRESSLEKCLFQMSADHVRRAQMGLNARQKVLKYYCWKKTARVYLSQFGCV